MSPIEEKPAVAGKRSVLRNLLFSALVLVFVIVALHVVSYFGLRHFNRQLIGEMDEVLKPTIPHFFDYLDVRLDFIHPFLKTTVVPNQHLPFCRVNRQGYRGPDFVREKTGAFRVAIVGGSAAMSWFANAEDETIHSCLQSELERAFPDEQFEVYNFAVFTYNSTQELFVLETEVLDYAPDFVIIFSGINDFGWGVEGHWQPRHPLGWFHMRSIIDTGHFQEDYGKRPLLRHSFKWSFLARTTRENLAVRWSPIELARNLRRSRTPQTNKLFHYGETEFALIGKRTQIWAENIEMMARMLDSFDIPYCASLQPCAFYHHEPSAPVMRVTEHFIPRTEDMENARRYLTTVYPAAEKALVARPYNIRTFDVTRCFKGIGDPVYFDLCHLNAAGTRILARRYGEHLRPFVERWRQAKLTSDSPTSQPL